MATPTLSDSVWQLYNLFFPPIAFLGTWAGTRHLCSFVNGRSPVTPVQEMACRGVAWFAGGFIYFVAMINGPVNPWMLLLIAAWAIALLIYYRGQARRLRERIER